MGESIDLPKTPDKIYPTISLAIQSGHYIVKAWNLLFRTSKPSVSPSLKISLTPKSELSSLGMGAPRPRSLHLKETPHHFSAAPLTAPRFLAT